MKQHELIVIEQLPIITERLKTISDEIDIMIAEATALPVTDESVKTVKAMRAKLTKEFNALEERRKTVKTAISAPYEAFEKVYKQLVSDKFKAADSDLKAEIDRNESTRKAERTAEVKAYFEEYAKSKHNDIADWKYSGITVGLSSSMKFLKEQAKAVIDGIESDLELIRTQEHKEEILVEYKKHMDVSKAITVVCARHRAIEEQKAKQEEIEAKKATEAEAVKRVETVAPVTSVPLAPPVVEVLASDPVRTLSFKVTAPLSKLRELKKFLDNGGYEYE